LLIHILKFFLSSVETFFNSGIIVDDGAQSWTDFFQIHIIMILREW
jgi:hypothetical protein